MMKKIKRTAFTVFSLLMTFQSLHALTATNKDPQSTVQTVTVSANKEKIDALIQTIQQRLQACHKLAIWKWNTTNPIINPQEEAAYIKKMAELMKGSGLSEAFIEKVFKAQIEASTMLQIKDFEKWVQEDAGKFPAVQDPRAFIEAIDKQILSELKEIYPSINAGAADFEALFIERVQSVLNEGEFDLDIEKVAFSPFADLEKKI